MRRFRQLLTDEDVRKILAEGTNGVLSLVDEDGLPYGVPLSYAYDGENRIYFHSALKGYKVDCIGLSSPCSFCVVAQDKIVPEEFTSYFRSVIVRGTISMVTQTGDIMKGLLELCSKYSPGIDPEKEIFRCLRHVAVLCLHIEDMTGKEAIELIRKRE